MKRIGLLGGTFDPVHLGHIAIARSFMLSGIIDELWVLLTPYPPHKLNAQRVPYTLRLQMLAVAFKPYEAVTVSTIENDLPKPSYTVNTIRHFKSKYKDHEYYFCMGEDSLAHFHTWKYYKRILSEARLLVASRPGINRKKVEKNILRRAIFVDHNPLAVSSSGIRQMINEGKNITDCVPEAVHEIIVANNLYRTV
ncbi:MAG: nicotinate (nicotinamide) nucleotide adenylyltransferase [Bacteroidota bacterium]